MDRTARFGAMLVTVTLACGGNDATGPSNGGGSGCRLTFVSVPDAPVPARGGMFAATFTTTCMLTFASEQSWITLTVPATFAANTTFTVMYTVAPNTTGSPRTGTIAWFRGPTDRGGGFNVGQM